MDDRESHSPFDKHLDAAEVLWRMQGPTKIVSAALIRRPEGTELRVFFEPLSTGELLSTQVETRAYRVRLLQRRAGRLRDALRGQGWVALPTIEPAIETTSSRTSMNRLTPGRLLRAGAGLGFIAIAGWGWWRRGRNRAAVAAASSSESESMHADLPEADLRKTPQS